MVAMQVWRQGKVMFSDAIIEMAVAAKILTGLFMLIWSIYTHGMHLIKQMRQKGANANPDEAISPI